MICFHQVIKSFITIYVLWSVKMFSCFRIFSITYLTSDFFFIIIIVVDDDNVDVFSGVQSKMGVVHRAETNTPWHLNSQQNSGFAQGSSFKEKQKFQPTTEHRPLPQIELTTRHPTSSSKSYTYLICPFLFHCILKGKNIKNIIILHFAPKDLYIGCLRSNISNGSISLGTVS